MPPEPRVLPRFAAEPPQESLPYGRFQTRLLEALLAAMERMEGAPAELGELGEVVWYPDRSWHGRTYIPATAQTSGGYEIFGYVRMLNAESELEGHADFTDATAEEHPEWQIDVCEETIGRWRGEGGAEASMTLVWGRPLKAGGALATAELADLAVDQCTLVEERFTLIAPDDYRGDLLEIKLWDSRGREIARESLYEGE
ncbi:MAG TPA: hypothetical protein VID70_05990 [Solirubrobacteraceae bacterium]|jgi:hypothetical protein